MKRLAIMASAAFVMSMASAMAQFPAAKQVFFQPSQDWENRYPNKDADYQQLFSSPEQWPFTLSHITAFGVPEHFAASGPAAELSTIYSFLNSHQVPLEVAFPVVGAWTTGCGSGVEGMSHQQNAPLAEAKHVQESGGQIAYIAFDEPLEFGHYYSGPNACRFPIDVLAQQVADNVKQILSVFPNAKIIDTEPVTPLGSHPNDLATWYKDLAADIGRPVDAVSLDVQWTKAWQTPSRNFVDVLAKAGLPYHLIADGSGTDTSDPAWTSDAQMHLFSWGHVVAVQPIALDVDSWDAYPDHVLPETDYGTLSYFAGFCADILGLPALR